jgi:hypothetical protein
VYAQIVPLYVEEIEQIVQLLLVGVHREHRFKELLRAHRRGPCATAGGKRRQKLDQTQAHLN